MPSDKHVNRNEHITRRKGLFIQSWRLGRLPGRKRWKSERQGSAQGKEGISGGGRPSHKVTAEGGIAGYLLCDGTGTANRSQDVGD